MIKIKRHEASDLLTRTVQVFPAEPEVLDCHYTRNQQMFADRVSLTFKKRDGDPWFLFDVVVTGDRRLASGARGAETKKNEYPSYAAKDRPDWLVGIIDFFTPEA